MKISGTKLVKAYNHKIVLDMDPFSLDSGKIYGLVGPNGIGKTTLLRILAGLESNHTGVIMYNGLPMNNSLMKKITYLSQTPYMMQSTVWENIAYPLQIRKINSMEVEERVAGILDEFGLKSLSDQSATSLSGGEAQKVALARALIFMPEVLLLDEPTASIDSETIETMEHAIRKRNKEYGMTAIAISHNKEQINRLCDCTMTINDGKLSIQNIEREKEVTDVYSGNYNG